MARIALLLGAVTLSALACGDSDGRTARAASPDSPSTTSARTAVAPQPTSVVEPGPATEPVVPVTSVSWDDAQAAYDERRYDDAVGLFESYTVYRPENPWGHYMLGLSAWKSGDQERALGAFDEALRLDPEHVKSLINSSRVLIETDRPADARERLERAVEIDPESGAGYRLLGLALAELGEAGAAEESYHNALILDSTDVWAMNNLGLLFIQRERFGEALLPLARAIELREDSPTFQNNLGIALERTGHFRAAEQAYRAALDADTAYGKAAVNLSRVEALKEDSSATSVDLALLSRRFQEEIEGWRRERAPTHATPGPVVPDSLPGRMP